MRVVCEACAAPVEEGRFLCAACLENFDKAKWAYSCRAKFEALIEPLRAIARVKGYALAVHGSLARDIDLLAAPWTDEAASAADLVDVLLAEIQRVNGHVYIRDRDENPARKPHGRLAWSIHLGGGPYIDLSVMPLRPLAVADLREMSPGDAFKRVIECGTVAPAPGEIVVDGRSYPMFPGHTTGADILALVSKDAAYRVFRDGAPTDHEIGLTETIIISAGDRFYTTPREVIGG